MINLRTIWAIFKRDFVSYFGNPTGYLFLAAFITLTMFWTYWHDDMFFRRNIVDLESMNQIFPWLLVGFVPTITMSSWSSERREGTDALLFTMPVRDSEVILGKFLSCVGVYTIALVVCMITHLVFLFFLGTPDLGLLMADCLAYWLLGVFFVALGVVASTFSENVTIGFVSGALLCLAFIAVGFLGEKMATANYSMLPAVLQNLSATRHFTLMTKGMLTLEDLFYFCGGTAVALYLNLVILSKRLWA